MGNVTRTAQSALLQVENFLGRPAKILPNTTLNEKLNINQDMTISVEEKPKLICAVIGNGGHKSSVGVNNIPLMKAYPYLARYTGLYKMLPFVLRTPDNDLAASERANYRLRREETHDGKVYVAYYGKVLDLSATEPTLELRSVRNGVVTSAPYTPTIGDLNPEPPLLSNTEVNVTDGDYLAVTAKVDFRMNPTEIRDFLNVAKIIYGDEDYAIISEIGLVSGVDKQVTGNVNGAVTGYTDIIAAQICSVHRVFYPAATVNTVIGLTIDAGAVEPLLTVRTE